MVNYREILRLHSLGQSQRTIRSSAHCSDNTVCTVLEVASQKRIQWPLDDDNVCIERDCQGYCHRCGQCLDWSRM